MILKSSGSPEASQSKPPTIRWTNNIDSEGNKQESYVGINWIIVGSASVAQQLPIESCTEFLWDLRIISEHTILQAPSSPENSCQKFKIVTYWYFGGCFWFLFTECLFSKCMFFWGGRSSVQRIFPLETTNLGGPQKDSTNCPVWSKNVCWGEFRDGPSDPHVEGGHPTYSWWSVY